MIADSLDFMPLARHCRASNFDPMTVGIILTDATGKIAAFAKSRNIAGLKTDHLPPGRQSFFLVEAGFLLRSLAQQGGYILGEAEKGQE